MLVSYQVLADSLKFNSGNENMFFSSELKFKDKNLDTHVKVHRNYKRTIKGSKSVSLFIIIRIFL